MKTMKRALSLVLVVLLIVAALPLSASAVVTGKIGSMSVKLVDLVSDTDAGLFSRPSQREQNLLKNHPNGVVKGNEDSSASTVADFERAMKALDDEVIEPTKATGSGTEADPYQIEKGSKFYVAIDINSYNTDGAGFLQGTTPVLQFPEGAFTVNTKSIAHPAVVGILSEAYIFEGDVGKYLPGAAPFVATTAAYLNKKDKDGKATDRFTNQFSGGSGFLPTTGSWEILIELTAGEDVGDYYVEIAPERTNANGGQCTAVSYNEKGRKPDGTYDAVTTANDSASTENIDFGERVYVKITDPSEAPDGTYTKESLINKKNEPFSTKTAGHDTTDYLKFPTDETKFRVGDTVMIYKTGETDGTYGELLGETTIANENLVTLNADGSVNAASVTLGDGDPVNTTEGLALKLVDTTPGTIYSADNSYLKNETEIYIARREASKTEPSLPREELKVELESEKIESGDKVYYYTEDICLVPEGALGSETNPVTINIGDSMKSVVQAMRDSGNKLSIQTTAPVESGTRVQNTVETNLTYSWTRAPIYSGALKQYGMTTDGVYTKHGKFQIRNPYQDCTKNGVKYQQPTARTDGQTVPTGGYASVIWVNVIPNSADYYLATKNGNTTLTVMNKTWDYLTAGDIIRLRENETDTVGQWKGRVNVSDPLPENFTFSVAKSESSYEFTPGQVVWLSYLNKAADGETYEESTAIPIRVTDGNGPIVFQDVEVSESFDKDHKLNKLLDNVASVTFKVVGPLTDEGVLEFHEYELTSAALKKWIGTDGDTYDALANTTIYTVDDQGNATESDIDTLNAAGKNVGDLFRVDIQIPESADYKTHSGATDVIDYTNPLPNPHVVKINAVVATEINIENATYSMERNAPWENDMKDVLKITGDTAGELSDALKAAPGKVSVLLKDENGDVVSTAYGIHPLTGDTNIIVEEKIPDTQWDYTVAFEQTARNKGTKLSICTQISDGINKVLPVNPDWQVPLQEEYLLFDVKNPAPDTVQIVKGDMLTALGKAEGDTYTAAEVIDYIGTLTGVVAPELSYGYKLSASAKDPAATWSMPLADNIYQNANWDHNATGDNPENFTITLKNGVVNWNALEALDQVNNDGSKLPINLPSSWTQPTITQKVEIVEKRYDETETPKPSEIIGSDDTNAQNNPYPKTDAITVHNGPAADGYQNLVVDIYTGYDAESGALSGHIASAKLGTDDTQTALDAELDDGVDAATALDPMGGKLWYTVRRESGEGITGLAPSLPIEKTYNVEDYILWTAEGLPSVSPDTLQMQYNEALTAGAVDFDLIKDRLPKTAKTLAVHLTRDGEGDLVARAGAEHTISVYPTVEKWLNADDGAEVTSALFPTSEPAAGTPAEYQLKAQYSTQSVTEAGDDPSAPLNEVNVTNGAGEAAKAKIISEIQLDDTNKVTPDTGYDITNNVALSLTNEADTEKMTIAPDHCAATVVNDNDKDNPQNYTVTFDITGVTNAGTGDTEFNRDTTDLILMYPDPNGNIKYFLLETPFAGTQDTATINVSTNGSGNVTVKVEPDNDLKQIDAADWVSPFSGLDYKVDGKVSYCFKESSKVKSAWETADYEKVSGALDLLDDIEVAKLHIDAGSLLTNQDLLDLVSSYNSASTTVNTQALVIPLTATGTPPQVSWTLKKSADGNPAADAEEIDGNYIPADAEEGTSPTATGWAEAMKNIPTDGKFYLEASLDINNATDGAGNAISVTNSGNKVAFISISLYTGYDPENPENQNPLQLTEGNSDVWKSLKPDSEAADNAKTAAQKYLDNLNAENAELGEDAQRDAASFRNELVFYYKIEGNKNEETLLEQEGKKEYVEKYTNPYLLEDGTEGTEADYSKLIESVSGTPIADVLTNNENVEITITEKVLGDDGYGTQRAALVDDHIQPNTGDSLTNYYDSSAATSSVVRGTEYYQIEYKVKVGTSVYVATRNVKLGYRTGDVDLDSNINGVDAGFITAYVNRTFNAFRDETGAAIPSLYRVAMDIDLDTNSNGVDAGFITAYVNRTYDLPPMRF